jgi:hypothetical protein
VSAAYAVGDRLPDWKRFMYVVLCLKR